MGSYGGQGGYAPGPSMSGETLSTPAEPPKPTYTAPARKAGSSKAMKLGGKSKDVDSFVDQLMSEGEKVTELSKQSVPTIKAAVPQVETER